MDFCWLCSFEVMVILKSFLRRAIFKATSLIGFTSFYTKFLAASLEQGRFREPYKFLLLHS
jgi:hypothetical protein